MIRRCFLLLWLLAAPAALAAAADPLTAAGVVGFTNAYRTWDGPGFAAAAALCRQACESPAATATNYYWLGVAEFHRALYLLGEPGRATNKVAAAATLSAAAEALAQAVKRDPAQAESHALLVTIYGLEISANWLRAAWLGPRLQAELRGALTFGTNNARVVYLLGTDQLFTARREAARREALTTLLRAETLFAAEAQVPAGPLEPRWGRDSCLTFIGSTYEKLDQPAQAAAYYRRALDLHPKNGLAQLGLERVNRLFPK